MGIEEIYSLARRELAEDLIFDVGGDSITFSIKGVLLARAPGAKYGFSFFDVSDDAFVLLIRVRDFEVYIGIEMDTPVEEEDYPEVARALVEYLVPKVALLVTKAEKLYSGTADIILDDGMGPALREFFYEVLMRHREGRTVYEQSEVA
ncbi:MAG: hypothetical protein PWQ79_1506 [Thermococcaceae archaeon]|nr:hypothetical protein [Thermococcaceae archaeon]MDK2914591.1 hypothetical protein [Thermococcaceae archaeon]